MKRAKKVRVDAVIAVGANLRNCKATSHWAEAFPGYVHTALGFHPTERIQDDIPTTLQFIEEKLDVCVAIGEIGLDHWNKEARKSKYIRERQRQLYIEQLQIAREYGKPASVHGQGSCRDALDIAQQHSPNRIVFHWYNGPIDISVELLDSGYTISATPASEFSRSHKTALAEASL